MRVLGVNLDAFRLLAIDGMLRTKGSILKKHTFGLLRHSGTGVRSRQVNGFCPSTHNPKITANSELGFNLELYVPSAYAYHLIGCDYESESWNNTEPFYFFGLDRHTLKDFGNKPDYRFKKKTSDWPFKPLADEVGLHSTYSVRHPFLPHPMYRQPNYRGFYKTKVPVFEEGRRVAIVAGKHNVEFSRGVFNTFKDPKYLRGIFDPLLDAGFTVVYCRPLRNFTGDYQMVAEQEKDDFEMINAEYSEKEVYLLGDVVDAVRTKYNADENTVYNLVMVQTYAQASIFVSTQGGNGVVASSFGGKNHILHKIGDEAFNRIVGLDQRKKIKGNSNKTKDVPFYLYELWGDQGTQIHVSDHHENLIDSIALSAKEYELTDRLWSPGMFRGIN